ncbi:MAG: transposase [Chloroflexi bacterium]|nr:MAG: transposase [Chloroflexota bacterium]
MPEYRRARIPGGTYFFTVVTYRKHPILAADAAVELLLECIRSVEVEHPFTTDAMVVLPDHLHCIWTLPEGDHGFSERWRQIKASFTRAYLGGRPDVVSPSMRGKGERGVWQRRFWEHVIRDEDDFRRHLDYIHYNPVKHRLVERPMQWKHSTFRSFVAKGAYPADWGANEGDYAVDMDLDLE